MDNLELSHRESFFHSVFVDLYLFFTLCILIVVPEHHATQVFISSFLVPCLKLAIWLWENPFFSGVCFLSLYKMISKLPSKKYVKFPDIEVLGVYNLGGKTK